MAIDVGEAGKDRVNVQDVFEEEREDQVLSDETQTEKRLKRGLEGLD